MRFAHEGVIHQTYLEAILHYLQDWYVLVPLVTVLGTMVVIIGVRAMRRYEEQGHD